MAGSPGRGGRGWGALIALVLTATLWPGFNPVALLGFPAALLLLFLPPRALPQRTVALLAIGVAAWGLIGDPLVLLNAGWAAVLAVWFLVAVYALPRAGFMLRAVTATAASGATAVVVALLRPDLLSATERGIGLVLRSLRDATVAGWKARGQKVPPGAVEMLDRFFAGWSFIAPAVAALASIAALAAAWWVYRRLQDAEARPLAPVREFRFPDELVWLAIGGIALVLIPRLNADAQRVGANLLVFMGALYALRGVAVLTALTRAGMGAGGFLLVAVVAVLMGGEVLAAMIMVAVLATVLVGLTDTWLDLRARVARLGGPGNDGVRR